MMQLDNMIFGICWCTGFLVIVLFWGAVAAVVSDCQYNAIEDC